MCHRGSLTVPKIVDLVQKIMFESIHTSRAVVSSNVIRKDFFDVFNSLQQTFMSHSAETFFFDFFSISFFPIALELILFSALVIQEGFKAKWKRGNLKFHGKKESQVTLDLT